MARIKLYPNDTSIQGGDKLVGTDINGNATKNYQIEEIAKYFAQTGSADPTRTGFQYNYAGLYSNQVISSGDFRYQIDPTSPANYGWANIIAIAISKYNRNNVDVSPVVPLLVSQFLKFTDVDSSSSTSYGLYKVTSQTALNNGNDFLLTLSHKGSTGTPSGSVLTISPSGLTDQSYTFEQSSSTAVWTIDHNLDRFPHVTVVNPSGNVVYGDIVYSNSNQIVITFTAPFAGKAYLN